MTNPGDIVRVRARRGGRASVFEANGWCQAFTQGLLDGIGVAPNTVADLNVLVGGTPSCPDVVVAKNPAGYRIALDLVGQQVIPITTPATNTRISSIIAYTNDLSLATEQNDVTGSPASCGLIVVNGSASSNPVAPSDTEIRAAITADGATGSQASYGVIAEILVSSNTTTITDSLINIKQACMDSKRLDWSTIPFYSDTRENNLSISTSSTSPTVLNGVTVDAAGVYLVLQKFTVRQTDNGKLTVIYGARVDNGEVIINPYAPYVTQSGDGLCTHNPYTLIRAEAGAKIEGTLYQYAGVSASIDYTRSLLAIKIAD